MSEIIEQAFTPRIFLNSVLNVMLAYYGIMFIFNIFCLAILNRHTLILYNEQNGDNYVFSSSKYFDDNKGTLGIRAWLLIFCPYYFIYYIIYYGKQLKRLYPESRDFLVLYYILALGITLAALTAGIYFQLYFDCGYALYESGYLTYVPKKYSLYPATGMCAGVLICYILQYATIKKYFSNPKNTMNEEY